MYSYPGKAREIRGVLRYVFKLLKAYCAMYSISLENHKIMITICYYLVPIISTIYCYCYVVHSSVSIVVRRTTHSPGEGHTCEFGEIESPICNSRHRSDTYNNKIRGFNKNKTRTMQVC